jgi:hypothetical protein
MPFEINRAKIQQKLENKVSKPTLAVSGNTTGRVGYLDARDNTPLSGWLTRAVSADTSTFVSSLFYGPDPLLLTRAVLGNTGGCVRATVTSNFFFQQAHSSIVDAKYRGERYLPTSDFRYTFTLTYLLTCSFSHSHQISWGQNVFT